MRTLQEKYNAIQQGKFSKEHFLAEARMQQPQLITRFNGYDDAVQILKNRGMIQEAKSIEEFSPYGSIAFSGEQEKQKETAPLSSLEVGDLVYIPGVSGDNIAVKDKRGDGTVGVGHPHNDKVSYQDGTKEVQVVKRANLEEAKLTKKSLTDYRYKPTNDMDKYPYEQILRGIRVELETLGVLGTPTAEEYTKALAKVSKNLEKDSIFYTNQVAGVNPKVDLHDKMVTATAKNTVDTFNGMKKAALKEGFKKLIKKVLSENSNDLADLFDADEEREERRYTTNDYGDHGPESEFGDSFDNMDPENYSEEEDDISHPRGYEEASDEEEFELQGDEDLDEMYGEDQIDNTEADKNMVRKLMAMYETEPSKFEKLHKQAQTQAATTKEIKFKHLLSLLDRAKAGALQSLTNQDRFEADREGMDEDLYEGKKSLSELLK